MSLTVYTNVDLTSRNTLGLRSFARFGGTFETARDLSALFELAQRDCLNIFPLGSGSNVLLDTWIDGIVLSSRDRGVEIDGARVTAGAGLEWDELVQITLARNLFGLENLSGIPGTVGAAPMQNIGAYGVELSDVIVGVEVFDLVNKQISFFDQDACRFGYRTSYFKTDQSGQYLITKVVLELSRRFSPVLEYPDLAHLPESDIASGYALRDAVLNIRNRKLPDYRVRGNAGSFFKNPFVTESLAQDLLSKGIRAYSVDNRFKVSAAALIEAAGLVGTQIGGGRISSKHALVLENTGQATLADILKLAAYIRSEVREQFGVQLEVEPQGLKGSPQNTTDP
ncbi:MAG: UDP-N-acetylmuramate dehydrogenase [Pseudomonadales bacterium]